MVAAMCGHPEEPDVQASGCWALLVLGGAAATTCYHRFRLTVTAIRNDARGVTPQTRLAEVWLFRDATAHCFTRHDHVVMPVARIPAELRKHTFFQIERAGICTAMRPRIPGCSFLLRALLRFRWWQGEGAQGPDRMALNAT